MTHNEISAIIVDVALHIHKKLGPGLLESVYTRIMAHELRKRGLKVELEVPVPVIWDGLKLDCAFRADLVVNDMVMIELKSVEQNAPIHCKQLLSHLRLADKRLGFVINFGMPNLKAGIFRLVNGLEE